MLTTNELLTLLTDVLSDDSGLKSRIRQDYTKFKPKMSDADARLFASISFLRRFIDDTLVSGE